MQCDSKNDEDHRPATACTSDFNRHRIARVRFPVRSERWKLCGHLFSARYLFPAPRHDDSLQKLRHGTVRQILEDARSAHELDKGTLGAVYTVQA